MTKFEKFLIGQSKSKTVMSIIGVKTAELAATLKTLGSPAANWAKTNGFRAASGQLLLVPDQEGAPATVLFGLGNNTADKFLAGKLAGLLPPGRYRFGAGFDDLDTTTLAFVLGHYKFERYKKSKPNNVVLECDNSVDRRSVLRIANAVKLTRDLINTPANDMGPQELQDVSGDLAKRYKAKIKIIKGIALAKGFPLIHAVGRASSRPPRLIDITWGSPSHKKLTLVGKGVVFDTGGLDLKPSSNMILMKKDMGGAANVLGLAQMIMDANISVRLRVLIPAVENAVSGDAYRPSDVLRSKNGKTVEVGNTDAEGRLVLADALTLADKEKPGLLIDMATLTGAARVALGTELSPFFVDDDEIAQALQAHGDDVVDPLWRMPFWRGYEKNLASKVADTNSISSGGFGGAITAALFLNGFVEKTKNHIHFDIYGWTPVAKPAHPVGGEAMAIRAIFSFLQQRYKQ